MEAVCSQLHPSLQESMNSAAGMGELEIVWLYHQNYNVSHHDGINEW